MYLTECVSEPRASSCLQLELILHAGGPFSCLCSSFEEASVLVQRHQTIKDGEMGRYFIFYKWLILPFGQHPETGAFHLLFLCFEFKSGLFLEARVVFFSFLFYGALTCLPQSYFLQSSLCTFVNCCCCLHLVCLWFILNRKGVNLCFPFFLQDSDRAVEATWGGRSGGWNRCSPSHRDGDQWHLCKGPAFQQRSVLYASPICLRWQVVWPWRCSRWVTTYELR